MPDVARAQGQAERSACPLSRRLTGALFPHAFHARRASPHDVHVAFQLGRLRPDDRVEAWHRRSSSPLAAGSPALVQAAFAPPITLAATLASRVLHRVVCQAPLLVRQAWSDPAASRFVVPRSTTEHRPPEPKACPKQAFRYASVRTRSARSCRRYRVR